MKDEDTGRWNNKWTRGWAKVSVQGVAGNRDKGVDEGECARCDR